MPRELRCYDYVNHAYPAVCAALRADALGIFRRATTVAAGRADALAPELHARVASFTIGVPIAIRVAEISEAETYGLPSTRLELSWHAEPHASLFPTMRAHLDVYPLSSRETQLDLSGSYEPPLGLLGHAGDALIARRIAEASVTRFVAEVAQYLRDHVGA